MRRAGRHHASGARDGTAAVHATVLRRLHAFVPTKALDVALSVARLVAAPVAILNAERLSQHISQRLPAAEPHAAARRLVASTACMHKRRGRTAQRLDATAEAALGTRRISV